MGAVIIGLSLLTSGCGDDGGSAGLSPTPGLDDTPTTVATDDAPADRSGELTGTWAITTFQLPGGVGEAETVGSEPVTITFDGDGTFTYSTGCNTGEGEWETIGVYQGANDNGIPVGQYIEFDGISATDGACDDERAEQDLAIGGAIRAARLFTLEGSTLTLVRDDVLMIEASSATG